MFVMPQEETRVRYQSVATTANQKNIRKYSQSFFQVGLKQFEPIWTCKYVNYNIYSAFDLIFQLTCAQSLKKQELNQKPNTKLP